VRGRGLPKKEFPNRKKLHPPTPRKRRPTTLRRQPPRRRAGGGGRRITVAVGRNDATKILEGETGKTVVRSRGTRREYELVSLLNSAGKVFRKVSVGPSPENGEGISPPEVRDRYGVIVLAVKRGQTRLIAPREEESLLQGDELFVAGTKDEVEAFGEGVR